MAGKYKMAVLLVVVLAACAHGGRGRNHRDRHDRYEHHRSHRQSESYDESTSIDETPVRRANKESKEGMDIQVSIDTMRTSSNEILHSNEPETTTEQRTTTAKAIKTKKTETTKTTKKEPTTEPTTPIMPPLNKRYRRIYNPDETALIKDYPYLAAILVNDQLWCGGAIIGSDTVLTAAHCLQLQYNNRFFKEYFKMLTVRVGSSNATGGGELYNVEEIFFHPNYKPETLAFNYAVVRLGKNITLGANATKIEYSDRRAVTIDKSITFLGWGSVLGTDDHGGAVLLQKVELPIYDKADCAEIYGRELVSASTFCAGYISKMKNVCNHDAGGPAVMDGELIGILSFSSKHCDVADRPAVFSSTGAAAEWLETIPEIRYKNDLLLQKLTASTTE